MKNPCKIFVSSIMLITLPATRLLCEETVAYLGVAVQPAGPAVISQLQLPEDTGLEIMWVDPKGPVAQILKVHDIIFKMDDQILVAPNQLAALIKMKKPSDKVKLTIYRKAKEEVLDVTLGETVKKTYSSQISSSPSKIFEKYSPPGIIKKTIPGINIGDENRPSKFEWKPNVTSCKTFSDGKYTVTIETTLDNKKEITVIDNQNNNTIYKGPWEEIEKSTIPEEIKGKIQQMEDINEKLMNKPIISSPNSITL